MVRRIKIVRLLFLCTLLLASRMDADFHDSTEDPKLKDILERCGDYCESLKKAVLYFVCNENIVEKVSHFDKKSIYKRIGGFSDPIKVAELKLKKIKEKTYLYDYQLIKKGESPVEKRILLKKNGKKKNQDNAELQLERILVKFLAYGPVGFLSNYWQDYFRFEITGEDIVEEREALIMCAEPSTIREDNYSFGRIWIDKNDFSILKIEWDHRSLKDFVEKVESRAGDLKRKIFWGTIYGVGKKGLRFPSQHYIEEKYVTLSGKEYTKYRVDIVYDNYKFFTVETDFIIRKDI